MGSRRPTSQIPTPGVQTVKGDKHGRRCDRVGGGVAQQEEPRDELIVEPGHFAVENQRRGGQLGDCRGDVEETARVIPPIAADKPHARASL
jgi:hypothetical protein